MSTSSRAIRGLTVSLLLAGVTVTGPSAAKAGQKAAQEAAVADGERSGKDPLAVSLSARVAAEPANVLVQTRLQPDPANRMLTIEWWSDDGVGGSHSIQLEGDREAAQHALPIRDLASGDYTVTAILIRSDRSEVRRQARVVVVGPGNRSDAGMPIHLAEQ